MHWHLDRLLKLPQAPALSEAICCPLRAKIPELPPYIYTTIAENPYPSMDVTP